MIYKRLWAQPSCIVTAKPSLYNQRSVASVYLYFIGLDIYLGAGT